MDYLQTVSVLAFYALGEDASVTRFVVGFKTH